MPKEKETKKQKEKKGDSVLDLENIRRLIDSMEDDLRNIKKILFEQGYQDSKKQLQDKSGVIEGIFDGEEMTDKKGKKYLVPPNYASKSKLIPGDILKLTVTTDGSFLFKQIDPAERKKLIGQAQEDNGKFSVKAEGKNYNILLASATYFKLKTGDKVTIIVPKNQESTWAALENKIE